MPISDTFSRVKVVAALTGTAVTSGWRANQFDRILMHSEVWFSVFGAWNGF
jgi:hypothetical protein